MSEDRQVSYLAYINTETGNIETITGVPGEIPPDGTVIGDQTVRYILSSELESLGLVDPATFMDENFWRDNYWISRGPKPGNYYIWQEDSWEVNTELLNHTIRNQRNSRLYDSDWSQAVDSPLSDEKKAEWRTYRQSLRDIMANLPADLDDPANVSWPAQPA